MMRTTRAFATGRSAVVGLAVPLLVVAGISATPPVHAAAPAARVPATRDAAIAAAVSQAASSGTQAEVTSARTFYTQLFADPNGQMMEQMSTEPLFGRDDNGQLVPVDTTLSQTASGIRPAATALSTVFPLAGGNAIKVNANGVDLTMSLPEALPAPTIDDSTATYPEVYPGVDLQLTATADGIRQVFVVKDATAAADPQLSQLTMALSSTSGTLADALGGSVTVLSSGGASVMSTGVPLMWDSESTALVADSSGGVGAPTHGVHYQRIDEFFARCYDLSRTFGDHVD